jgi:anaerobic selenocysteine-containing dehydrogenase
MDASALLTETPMRTAYRTCPLCEACCGLALELEGDRVVKVRGDEKDPFSKGYLCAKGAALGRLHNDPARLRRPLVRGQDGAFREAGWDEAIERAAEGLAGVIARHGRRSALAHYIGNPIVHDLGALLASETFHTLVCTRNRFTANSQDANPHLVMNLLMFGMQSAQPVPDLNRARHLIILGANPLASNGSLMTAPAVGARLRAIMKRGGRVVVIDPRRTETARIASEHLPIRPGGDAALLLAMAQTLLAEGIHDRAFCDRWTRGAEALPGLLAPFTPERVGPMVGSGLTPETVRRLARDLVRERGVVYARVGVCLSPFAGLAVWALNLVNALAGALDRRGRAMFPEGPADGLFRHPPFRGSYDSFRSPQGAPEINGEYPCHLLAEQIERGVADAKAREAVFGLVVFSGNPVLSAPNGRRIARALDQLEHMVAVDIYLSETARHADVVLPPASKLHGPHFDPILGQFAVERFARWSEPSLPPTGDQPSEYDLVMRLTREVAERIPRRRARDHARLWAARAATRLSLERLADLLIRAGALGTPGWRGLSLRKLRKHKHGVPARPLREGVLPRRLLHRDRRIDLAPEPVRRDLPRLVRALGETSAEGLLLIGRRHLKSNNSWFRNVPRMAGGVNRCTLLVHPDDAGRLGLDGGGRATVRSRVGEVEATVEVSADVMPGVVSLPHGWGAPDEPGRAPSVAEREVARAAGGASVNDLTDEALHCAITGNAGLNGVPVEVVPVTGNAPVASSSM